MKPSPSSDPNPVAEYFDRHAVDFDTIYASRKGPIRSLRDRVTRGTVVRRLDFVKEAAARERPESVLDVGCGSGRFAIDLALGGSKVIGLDFAPDMLRLAREQAEKAGVAEKCTFLDLDFMTWEPPQAFDLVLAIGVLDYIDDAEPFVARLAGVAQGSVIISFPRALHPLVPMRLVRLRLSGCPVHFYRRSTVEAFGRRHFEDFRVVPFARDFLLVGRTSRRDSVAQS
jgi:SAM-dependent methyltransferase